LKKVSLIWFSSSGRTYRVVSLKTLTFYFVIGIHLCVYGGFLALLGMSLYQNKKISQREEHIRVLAREVASLKHLLEKRDARIASLKGLIEQKSARIQSLEKNLAATQEEVKDIKRMEIKIRRYLGLDQEEDVGGKYSHQGGFEYNKGRDRSIHISPSSYKVPEVPIKDLPVFSEQLREDLSQVVEFLKKRQKELSHIPSILPVKGDHLWISCGFGWRKNPFTSKREFHGALDIAGAWKTPIIAPADGVVIKVGRNNILGNYIRIRHTPHITTLYGHLYKIIVKKGQKVKRGDVIGYMGNTGHSTGTHLHYKIEVDGKPVNPVYYIYDRKITNLVLR